MNPIKRWLRRRNDRKILIAGMMAGVVPVIPDMSDEEKKKILGFAVEQAGKIMLMAWYTCDLKTHYEGTLYNEPTDEYFSFEIKKIKR